MLKNSAVVFCVCWCASIASAISPGSNLGKKFLLPVMTPADFNEQISLKLGNNSFEWRDLNLDKTFLLGDGSIDAAEFSGKDLTQFLVEEGATSYFTEAFIKIYSEAAQTVRSNRVAAELLLTTMETEITDVRQRLRDLKVSEAEISVYLPAIKTLMEAAPIMQLLYDKQIGTAPDEFQNTVTLNDKDLFSRYGHPWCLADTSPLCTVIPTFPKRRSGIIPDGVSCEKANSVGSPFQAIQLEQGQLIPISYSVLWSGEHEKLSSIMKSAAAMLAKIPREAAFVTYLSDLAEAYLSADPFPYAKSDVSWTRFLVSDSVLFMRVGPDEVGGDGLGDSCESRARYHFNLGIRNQAASDIIEKIKSEIQNFENKLADLINDSKNYVARPVKVQLPTFLDVIYAKGDDVGGPSGTTIGQTLPNWCGSDGMGECEHGTMIYVNKTLKAYSEKIIKAYIMPLFDDSLGLYFNSQNGLASTVYHEMFHNLGPRESIKKPNSEETYGEKLVTAAGVSWKLPLEELKAQTGSLYMAEELLKKALSDPSANTQEEIAKFRQHVVYDLAWAFRMIVRGSRNGPEFNPSSPYSKLAAVQVGFLTRQGALSFNTETKKWSVNFDKMSDAIVELMRKVGTLYATTDVTTIEQFFLDYMKGEGEKLLHRDVMVEVAGKMPSVLFNYQLQGLE